MEPTGVRRVAVSNKSRSAGRVVTAIPMLLLFFDLGLKIAAPQMVAEASARLGRPRASGRSPRY